MPTASRLQVDLRAPAKLNLALAVGAPVPPKGYHPIASWFVPIDLCDELTLTALPPGSESVHGIAWHDGRGIDWPLEKDLAVRAHRAVERLVGRALPVRLTLRKRIPTGGGLGGGSSDAASMLMGVNRLYGLGLPHGALAELANRLGSDVAFFLDEALENGPRPAIVTGFGERVERVARVAVEAVLILPPMGCPTADVYRAFDQRAVGATAHPPPAADDLAPREAAIRATIDRASREGRVDPAMLFNDLEPAAHAAVPALRELVESRIRPALRGLEGRFGPLRPHMTGSGSTLFVVTDASRGGSSMAAEVAAAVETGVPGVRCMATRAL